MSAAVVEAVLRAVIEPASVKLMAVVVAWHFNDERGRAWAGLGTMARECGLSERHAKRALKALKDMGVLVVLRATAGGDRYATTTHYGFNLQTLASISNPVRQRTGGAGAPGTAAPDDLGSDGDKHPAPRAPAAPNPVRGRPVPRAPAAPKRDERKPEASFSSKAAPAATEGQAAVGRSSLAASAERPTPTRQPNSQQPHRGKAAVIQISDASRLPKRHERQKWLNDDALLSQWGIALGLEPLHGWLRTTGKPRHRYMVAVLEATPKERNRPVREKRPARKDGAA